MNDMSELYFLPAKHGDAFFLHCIKDNNEGWIIVDGGPSGNARHNPFVNEVEKLPSHDLMVMTHQDDDHLMGIRAYIKTHMNDECFPVKRLWVNCARHMDFPKGGDLSPKHASNMADMLAEITKGNELKWTDRIVEGYHDETIKFADIDILNPAADMLDRFIPVYEEKAGVAEEKGSNLTAQTVQRCTDDYAISLEELAMREKEEPTEANYSQFANMVSISFVVRCKGLSILMLGDSFPQQIVAALKSRDFSSENKLKVDFVKVAHHGSRNNISNELLDMIDCHHYLISTNGGAARSYHPDREAMANIICHEGRDAGKIHLHFNYKLAEIEASKHFKLFHEEEPERYNFVIHEPGENAEGCQYRIAFD